MATPAMRSPAQTLDNIGGPGVNRTPDQRLRSPLLYPLSYGPVARIITSIRDGPVGPPPYDGAVPIRRTPNMRRQRVPRKSRRHRHKTRARLALNLLSVLTVQMFRLRRVLDLIVDRKSAVAVSDRPHGSWYRLDAGRPHSRAPTLATDADCLRPTVFARSDLKRHRVACLERAKTSPLNVAKVHKEISVHCLALDEPPPVLKSRHGAGIACVVTRDGITAGDR